jgi:hypothetical protein
VILTSQTGRRKRRRQAWLGESFSGEDIIIESALTTAVSLSDKIAASSGGVLFVRAAAKAAA